MTHTDFREWVPIACQVLGGTDRFRETLEANADVFVDDWKAELGELGSAITRLVSEGRVPTWPNELTNAIHKELGEVRERARVLESKAASVEAACSLCDGTGLVIVPHPLCVFRGQVAPYFNPRTKERRWRIYSIAVICDTPDCDAGIKLNQQEYERTGDRVEAQKRPKLRTLSSYSGLIGGLDGAVLWREHERRQAEQSRRVCPRSEAENTVFDSLLNSIKKRAEG